MTLASKSMPVERWADVSDDGLYRYLLGCQWDDTLSDCLFIMLNPLMADATQDDPTIRRCIRFARDLGCGYLLVCNLYAFRATDPCDLIEATEPTGGAANDAVLKELMVRGRRVVAAWGAHPRATRASEILSLSGADRLTALGTRKSGAPRHPLYVNAAATPKDWRLAV